MADIRTANEKSNAYTQCMADFLQEVCDAAGTTTEKLFIVPGNHDIDRDHAKRMEAVRRVKYQPDGNTITLLVEISKSNSATTVRRCEKKVIKCFSVN